MLIIFLMEYPIYLVSRICATGMNKKLQIYLIESDNFPYLITEENVRRFQASNVIRVLVLYRYQSPKQMPVTVEILK